jgi:effector-binding domain-containing protein
MISFYDFNLENLLRLVEFEGAQLTGSPMAMFYDFNPANGTTDMAVAIPYNSGIKTIPEGVETITLPAAYYVTTDYIGGHHGIRKAHVAIEAFLKDNHAEIAPPFLEVYTTDGQNERDSTKFLTKVVYFVK